MLIDYGDDGVASFTSSLIKVLAFSLCVICFVCLSPILNGFSYDFGEVVITCFTSSFVNDAVLIGLSSPFTRVDCLSKVVSLFAISSFIIIDVSIVCFSNSLIRVVGYSSFLICIEENSW